MVPYLAVYNKVDSDFGDSVVDSVDDDDDVDDDDVALVSFHTDDICGDEQNGDYDSALINASQAKKQKTMSLSCVAKGNTQLYISSFCPCRWVAGNVAKTVIVQRGA